MALFVSRLNECPFCIRAHTETTRLESRGEVDPGDPGVMRAELAAVLPLLERMTTAPDDLGPDDVEPARQAGVPDDAIEDALHVGFLFNTVNRMGNAFGWSWDSDDHVRVAAKVIHRISYRLPSFALR
jgi:alkylhydroperoxidase family enzyme